MTQYPSYGKPGMQTQTIKPESNGLGMAGMIVSIIGLVTCGFVSPIGLILSLIGLRKQPRGLAIAGSVIGLVGTGFLFFAGIAIVSGFLGLKKAVGGIATEMQSQEAAQKILKEKAKSGSLPGEATGNSLISAEKDAWQHAFRYKPSGTTFKIVSDGPDGKPDTADDLSFTEEQLKTHFATTRPSSKTGTDADADADEDSTDSEKPALPDGQTPDVTPAEPPEAAPAPAPAPPRTRTPTVAPKTTTPKTAPKSAAPKATKPPAKTSDDGL